MRPDEGADENFGEITEFKPRSEGFAEEKT
jgi:hypothetical protein